MVAAVVVLAGVILLVALVLVAVYFIQPEDFKINAELLKLIKFSMEIKKPRSRLPKPPDDDWLSIPPPSKPTSSSSAKST